VTGPLGAAGAGLLLLERPDLLPGLPARGALVAAHRRPEPRVAEGWALARGGARALMDVSDGLGLDARRMALASGLRARIDLAALPLADGVAEVAGAVGDDPALLALTAGEDYALLAAVPPARLEALRAALGGALHVVGALEEGDPGIELAGPDGPVAPPPRLGWEHGA
jgi:thiamine-monophosphate kinase